MKEDDYSTLEIQYQLFDSHMTKSVILEFENPAKCLYVLAKIRYLM